MEVSKITLTIDKFDIITKSVTKPCKNTFSGCTSITRMPNLFCKTIKIKEIYK